MVHERRRDPAPHRVAGHQGQVVEADGVAEATDPRPVAGEGPLVGVQLLGTAESGKARGHHPAAGGGHGLDGPGVGVGPEPPPVEEEGRTPGSDHAVADPSTVDRGRAPLHSAVADGCGNGSGTARRSRRPVPLRVTRSGPTGSDLRSRAALHVSMLGTRGGTDRRDTRTVAVRRPHAVGRTRYAPFDVRTK